MNQVLSFFRHNKKKQSFEALLAPHINLLYKVAYQYTGQQADAEDLVQELLMYLFANKDKWMAIEKLKPWLMKCLYNKFVDGYRKQKHSRNTDSLDDDVIEPLAANLPAHDDQVLHQQILSSLSDLSENQRVVVTQHDINGYTLVELSEMMDKPVGTLKSDLHRARAKLKSKIKLQPSDVSLRLCK